MGTCWKAQLLYTCVCVCVCGCANSMQKWLWIVLCVAYACKLQSAYLVIQTGNEKTSLSTDTAVMFYSWVVLQVMTALCRSFVYHGKRGTEPSSAAPSWVSSPLNHTLYAYADLTCWLGWRCCQTPVSVQSTPHKVIKERQREAERGGQSAQATLSVFGQGLVRALRTEGGWEDWSNTNLGKKQGFVSLRWP